MSGLRGVRLVGLFGAGLAVLAVIGGGCTAKAPQEAEQTTTETAEEPIPSEAKEFIAEYGARYSDPLSTYYAEKAYRDASDQGSMITDAYVAEYDINSPSGGSSDLGFEFYELPLDSEVSAQLSLDVFNNYTARQLTIYMNTLARNPNGKEVIDDHFKDLCSYNSGLDQSPGAAFTKDDPYVENLMDTFGSIVDRHGSNAHYTVTMASETGDDESASSFDMRRTPIVGTDDHGHVGQFSCNADIVVRVDVYNADDFVTTYETIEDVELTIIRQPYNTTDSISGISIGQVK